MARDLAMCASVIVYAPQVVAVGHRRERAVEWKNFETVSRQIEFANDLRPEQRDDVGTDGEAEAAEDLLGDGCATHHVSPFEDENPSAGGTEVGGSDETVVAAADDDGVVLHVCDLTGREPEPPIP